MNHRALTPIQSAAINQLIHPSASLRPPQNPEHCSIRQSEPICDTLETGDPDSGGRQLPQPTILPVANSDDGPQDDSISSGSMLDIAG